MYDEDSLLPISLLQHLLYCPRRAALVLLEDAWAENIYTAEGRVLHERTHDPGTESRAGVRIARGLQMRSLKLGLTGKTDVVEFHKLPQAGVPEPASERLPPGVALPSAEGLWRPFPVEYKRGKLRREQAYEVQLCAQALCLEEMLNVAVTDGAIFYGKTARRMEISFDRTLREVTEASAVRLHGLLASRELPRCSYGKKCDKCSIRGLCLPKVTGSRRSVRSYVSQMVAAHSEGN
ncbi:CRISPR-associated protein Cas4 [Thermodesulfobacteriota bacterium]